MEENRTQTRELAKPFSHWVLVISLLTGIKPFLTEVFEVKKKSDVSDVLTCHNRDTRTMYAFKCIFFLKHSPCIYSHYLMPHNQILTKMKRFPVLTQQLVRTQTFFKVLLLPRQNYPSYNYTSQVTPASLDSLLLWSRQLTQICCTFNHLIMAQHGSSSYYLSGFLKTHCFMLLYT